MNLNTKTYALDVTAISASVEISPEDGNQSSLILTNDGTIPVFVVSGITSAPTAVYPTNGAGGLQGTIVMPDNTVTYSKNVNHRFIAAILKSAGAGVLNIKVGAGE